jgi:superfamily I DNA/RNA helicase
MDTGRHHPAGQPPVGAHVSAPFQADPSQQQVIDHVGGPLLYLGAPGTGTTTTLAAAIAARVRSEGADAVWAITVGRRAAADLRSLVAEELGSGALPTITTIHGLALSLVRTWQEADPDDATWGGTGVRLLSGAEEDVRVRELIRGTVVDGTVDWPEDLAEALPTLGLANEVRAYLARLRELGRDPSAIAAGSPGDQLSVALGQFADIEDQAAALENVVDYAGLVELALQRAGEKGIQSDLHRRITSLYVDEFHDLDPLQARLLDALASVDATYVVSADPACSIYGFRGADPRVLGEFLDRRVHPRTGEPPIIVVAGHLHRGSTRVHAQVSRVLGAQPTMGVPAAIVSQLRDPQMGAGADAGAGVNVCLVDSASDLSAHVGRMLREVHLRDGIPWSEIAVIARTTRTLTVVRRGLESVGVPVQVLAADIPLPDEPAVSALLAAVDAAGVCASHPQRLTATQAADLLAGPLMAADIAATRSLARSWRSRIRNAYPGQVVPAFADLQREALLYFATGIEPSDGDRLSLLKELAGLPAVQRLRDAGALLGATAGLINRGAPPGEVLWHLWSSALPDTGGETWPDRLRRAALAGHRASGHDLDAVMALFDTAQRLTERFHGVVGVRAFIAAIQEQRVAAEAIAERGDIGHEAVTLVTAFHAKARSWHTVVVLDLQEGVWPARLGRQGILELDELLAPDLIRNPAARIAQSMEADRRLCYVALTRARHRTIIAAVASSHESGEQPSRFITDIVGAHPLGMQTPKSEAGGAVRVTHLPGRPPRPLTLDGLVAELRTVLLDPHRSTDDRQQAAQQLAALALQTDEDGRALVPAADPTSWWHVLTPTTAEQPVRPRDEPVRLSASAISSLVTCPLQWFLDREVRASDPGGSAAAIGTIVHTLAEALARGEVDPEPQVLDAWLGEVWPHLGMSVQWHAIAERTQVREAIARLCHYQRHATREVVDVEVAISGDIDLVQLARAVNVEVPESLRENDSSISVTGRIDRIERDDDGALMLIDFKTSATLPSRDAVNEHLQLALYQAAVMAGAVTGAVSTESTLGDAGEPLVAGAALVELRHELKKEPGQPRVLEQPPLSTHASPEWFIDAVADAVAVVRDEDFTPRPGKHCSYCAFTRLCPTQMEGEEVST